MRIATWNVNSIRTRVDRVVDFLKRADIDKLIRGHVVAMPNTGRQTPAEEASIADRLTRVFDRADAKTQPTGEESSIGQTPLEGSVSL